MELGNERVKEKLKGKKARERGMGRGGDQTGRQSLWIYKVEECLLSFRTEDDTVKNGDRRDQRIEIHRRVSLKRRNFPPFKLHVAPKTHTERSELKASQRTLHNNKLFKSIWIWHQHKHIIRKRCITMNFICYGFSCSLDRSFSFTFLQSSAINIDLTIDTHTHTQKTNIKIKRTITLCVVLHGISLFCFCSDFGL